MAAPYRDCTLGRFAELVAAREPTPGGGPVAAITLSLAAGLAAMAARYSTEEARGDKLVSAAEQLSVRALDLADTDAAAYQAVVNAYGDPGDDDPECRTERVRATMQRAAEVALEIAQVGAETATLAAQLAIEGNQNVRGEALTAVLLAEAATRSAAHLVAIDVDAGSCDEELVRRAARSSDTAHAASSKVAAVPATRTG